jgi:bla regulator protein BlaR1
VALLLAVTLLAVLRLLALRAKASVLVEPSWLSALAHAQRRMDFKHGTALLTSSELKSPISWGLFRPVILLNDEALKRARARPRRSSPTSWRTSAGSTGPSCCWAGSRPPCSGSIRWSGRWPAKPTSCARKPPTMRCSPSNVAGVDYAQLLVGVARHDCKGLLLGAHGVAPGKGSLTRRVKRVLDGTLPRTPMGKGFAAGLFMGVVATAAPLAAHLQPARCRQLLRRRPVIGRRQPVRLAALAGREVGGRGDA